MRIKISKKPTEPRLQVLFDLALPTTLVITLASLKRRCEHR
jgi:hypothetical protein